ncbi:hypothetical protein QPL79_07770 [Ignisphaera sp. 4213-co]|uniref:Uncharacterized protein n=1 Tax=Ignisphaera cupida TaxID=3050454 RepID=A0ABD4ZAD3_9CREN|nr:hypothetical protein [Ignisphaera sp. 4213-co]MDK6029260.1 hypothetical protein [Ignisphaera sp. 4213-co]
MIRTGILRSVTTSIRNVFSKNRNGASNSEKSSVESVESIVIYSNNRMRDLVTCIPTLPAPVCFERDRDGYIKIM